MAYQLSEFIDFRAYGLYVWHLQHSPKLSNLSMHEFGMLQILLTPILSIRKFRPEFYIVFVGVNFFFVIQSYRPVFEGLCKTDNTYIFTGVKIDVTENLQH